MARPNIKNTAKQRSDRKARNDAERKNILDKTKHIFLERYYSSVSMQQYRWHYNNGVFEIVKCICGKPAVFKNKRYKNCSSECSKRASLLKYKNTCMKTYGVETTLSSPVIRAKIKKTLIEKYGVDNPFKSDKIMTRIRNDYYEKHGVHNPFQSEDVKLKIRKTCEERYNSTHYLQSETYRQRMIKQFGEQHPFHNTEYYEMRSNTLFLKKKYVLPSGKIIMVQGYEPYALDILLTEYSESDILYSIGDICKYTGIIRYVYKNKIHRYYPDFFIICENKVIEVKSMWILNLHRDINLLKRDECLRLGFNFEFMIFHNGILKDRINYLP